MNAPAEAALLRAAAAYDVSDALDASDVFADTASAVTRLCAAIDAAFAVCATPDDPSRCVGFSREVRAALARAVAEPGLIAPGQREGSAQTYRRHVLAACALGRYTIAALVWQPGQASPIHAHRTWCGYAVLEGTLTEMLYAWDDAHEGARAIRSQPRASGAVAFGGRGRANVHRLSNEGNAQAISLHVYGVAEAGIATDVNEILPPI